MSAAPPGDAARTSPKELLSHAPESVQVSSMTSDVSDAEFKEAFADVKFAEKMLHRDVARLRQT